jgi:hypothetical protein
MGADFIGGEILKVQQAAENLPVAAVSISRLKVRFLDRQKLVAVR